MASGIVWKRSPAALVQGLGQYEQRLIAALDALALYWTAPLEASAKANAPWTDRTGNARQTLFSVREAEREVVRIYLSHGVPYGKWLELCNSGRYAIVMKTLQRHYGPIMDSVRRLVE